MYQNSSSHRLLYLALSSIHAHSPWGCSASPPQNPRDADPPSSGGDMSLSHHASLLLTHSLKISLPPTCCFDLCSPRTCALAQGALPPPRADEEASPGHKARLLLSSRIYILVTFLPSQSFRNLSMDGKSIGPTLRVTCPESQLLHLRG